eukprot:TRINITY_DN5090_c1_g1_i2.p5 TRINITY_DN5090_c1_g1~~TRINITY_DN5090_c1_g1_i2.p5  ORF type:complete len:117 (-),score=1.04 TRINITY_DN5090_c1_g1_i2:63-413(-)
MKNKKCQKVVIQFDSQFVIIIVVRFSLFKKRVGNLRSVQYVFGIFWCIFQNRIQVSINIFWKFHGVLQLDRSLMIQKKQQKIVVVDMTGRLIAFVFLNVGFIIGVRFYFFIGVGDQ